MSKLIKSSRVNISSGAYKLSSEVFISKEKYFADQSAEKLIAEEGVLAEGATDQSGVSKDESDAYSPKTLIEQAEQAALEIMDNAQAAADALIDDARISARQIEEDALGNANKVYEDAKQNGKAEGYDEGYSSGKAEADSLIREALEIKRQIKIKNDEFLVDKESEIIKMVLAISKKVLAKEVEDIEYIEALTSAAMEHLSYATSIVLRVADKDLDAANLAKPKIMAMAERIESLDIKADYALPPGSCIIDTVSGSIDASVKTQLERIEDIFTNIIASNENVR